MRMPPLRWAKPALPSSVRERIIAGFGLLVIILAVVVASAAWLSREHQSDLAAMEHHTSIADLLQDTEIAAATSATYLVGYLSTGDELLLPPLRSALATSEENMVAAVALEKTQGHDRVPGLEELENVGAELNSNTHTMIATAQAGEREQAFTAMQAQNARYMQWLVGLTRVVDSEQQQVSALKSRAERTGDLAFWLLVLSGATGGALGLMVSIVIARSILRPLSSLESTARGVAGGDLAARADTSGPRELSHLGQTLNSMLATVQQRTDELQSANEELRQRNRQLLDARAQAASDPLTGLSNHRTLHERAREEVHRVQETGSPVGLIMMDIDDFKRVNDSQGHQAGDEILREITSCLTDAVEGEKVYRYGGDEFAVLLSGIDIRKTARVAERLRRAVERQFDGSGEKITVSMGVASFPEAASSAEELIYSADAAMYWAKSAGKNRVGDWGNLVKHMRDGTLPWYAADRSVKAPDVVTALGAALAAKDPTTAAHTERCSWYTAKLADELGLAEEEKSIVRLASLLHDMGKLAVPDEVLFKPGPLNEEEWAQMKQHSTAAPHMLSHIRSLGDAVPAILHHHEHFDGSGYPDGMAGEQIPIASRILLVTDAFDAMTTDRPYRKAMPIETAIEELKHHSGSQFDPAVADAFFRVLSREGAQPLRRMAAAQARPVAAAASGS